MKRTTKTTTTTGRYRLTLSGALGAAGNVYVTEHESLSVCRWIAGWHLEQGTATSATIEEVARG